MVEIAPIFIRNQGEIRAIFPTVEEVVSGSAQSHRAPEGDEAQPHSNHHTRQIALYRDGNYALPGSGFGLRGMVGSGTSGEVVGGGSRWALGSY